MPNNQADDSPWVDSQARFDALLWTFVNVTSEAIVVIDDRQRIVLFNQAAQAVFGYSELDVLGRPLDCLLTSDTAQLHKALVEDFKLGNQETRYMAGRRLIFGMKRDGELFPAEASITKVEMNGRCYMAAVLRDVSERQKADVRHAAQVRRLATLRSIDLAVAGSLDLRLTLNVIVDQIQRNLGGDAICVCTLNRESAHFEFATGTGFHHVTSQNASLKFGQGALGLSVSEQRTIVIHDLDHEASRFRPSPIFGSEGFVSGYACPLMAKGRVLGSLGVFFRSEFVADDEWVSFLEGLCGPIAVALDDAMMFEQVQHANFALIKAYDATIEGWSRALDLRDKETEGHSLRVTELTVRLARALGLSEHDIVHIRRGALLHDIGKMGIPDHVLLKAGPLTEDEWLIMRKHPTFAYEMLSPIDYLRPALDIPYCHHEKWDGSGYPRGLKGEQIPIAARIFAIVDVWDALKHRRPYRKSVWPTKKVLSHFARERGHHFDPQVVDTFLELSDL
ncbi:MAG: HD domain-containing phosphohydrolase [Fimbriimonas sp.]|nr:HD domain-containing phosphohydrolase [Fimbriimonas sp.]